MLADGAVGSELNCSGIALERMVDANRSHPQTVRELHRRAIDAGAAIITTNTFGSPDSSGWAAGFQAGVELAVETARNAEREIAVMLSVYPAELLREPEIVLAPFREVGTQDCLLLIETATDVREAADAVAIARASSNAVILATCHFQADGNMPDGTTALRAAAALQQVGAAVVGANCGTLPEEMAVVARQMRTATDLPLLFQPNAGLPRLEESQWAYPVSPERFAAVAASLFDVGASIVGGCCGATPTHIAAVHRLLFHPQRRE